MGGREESVLAALCRTGEEEGKDWGMITNLFERTERERERERWRRGGKRIVKLVRRKVKEFREEGGERAADDLGRKSQTSSRTKS